MAKKKLEKSKDIEKLPDPDLINKLAADVIADGKSPREARETRFLLFYLLGYKVQTAGKMAGYAPSTCQGELYRKIKNPSILRERITEILSRLPEQYRQWCKARLLDVVEIDRKVLDLYLDDPLLAIKHPRALRQIKEGAGALGDEAGPAPHISVDKIQVYIAERANILDQTTEAKPVDSVQAIEVKPIEDDKRE